MSAQLEGITELKIDGTGSFDKLMSAVYLHIEQALNSSQITQEQAGAIYTNVIPSIVHESVNFEMQKDVLNEQLVQEKAKTQLLYSDLEVKDAELKQLGITIDNSVKDGKLKDKQIVEADKQIEQLEAATKISLDKFELDRDTTLTDIKLKEKDLELKAKQVTQADKQIEQLVIDTELKQNKFELDRDIALKDVDLKQEEIDMSKSQLVIQEAKESRDKLMFAKELLIKESDVSIEETKVARENTMALSDKKKLESEEIQQEMLKEQLVELQEKNGVIDYIPIFYSKYINYNKETKLVAPTLVDGTDGSSINDYTYSDSITVEPVFQVYLDGINEWNMLTTDMPTNIDTLARYISFRNGGNAIHTNVLLRNNPSALGDVFAIKDDTDSWMIVPYINDETAKPTAILSPTASTALKDLRYFDPNDTSTVRTIGDSGDDNKGWLSLLDEFADNGIAHIVTFIRDVSTWELDNPNNRVITVLSENGYNGTGDNPDNKPNSLQHITYPLTKDETNIYKTIKSTFTEDSDSINNSLISLQKQEVIQKMELADRQSNVAVLPTTFK